MHPFLFLTISNDLDLASLFKYTNSRRKPWFPFGLFRTNEQCEAQMETSTKNENERQKAFTNNKRHLPVLVFEIELILSQKQERATKSSKRQRTANGNMQQKPKRATKSNKEYFSFKFSFIHTISGPMEGGWYQEQWKARKSNDGQRKSNEKQQEATTSNKKQQRTSELEKPKRARKNQDEQRKAQKVQMEARLKWNEFLIWDYSKIWHTCVV